MEREREDVGVHVIYSILDRKLIFLVGMKGVYF